MAKEIRITSNTLINIANELGDCFCDNNIELTDNSQSILTLFNVKCIISDFLFEKFIGEFQSHR